jgi:hypothetical protein
MGWQSPLSQTTITWTLQETRHGSRLRVVEWGHVGADEVVREQTLGRLFDVGLRALVEREVTVPAGGVAMPVIGQPGPPPEGAPLVQETGPPAVAPVPAPVEALEPTRRKRRWPTLIAVLLLLVLLAGLAVWLIWPPEPAGGGVLVPSGSSSLGPSPDTGTASTQPGPDPGVVVPGRSGGPPAVGPFGVTPGPSATQSAPGGPSLTVNTSEAGTLVTVSLTNSGGTVGNWRAIGILLNGLNALVTVQSGDVTYTVRNGTYCFSPTTPMMAAVASQTTSNFIFNVTLSVKLSGALITSVALDSSPCV